MFFQGFAFDKIHDQIPASCFAKLLVNAWQVWMRESSQDVSFTLEVLCGLRDLLWVQTTLTHFFHSEESIAQLYILSPIDGTEAPLAYPAYDAVALLDQEVG